MAPKVIMDECDEVAAAMLPKYLEWKAGLPFPFQGHSSASVANYVMAQLREYESYVVIDNVTEALQKLVLNYCGGTYVSHLLEPK
jgi:hypothetical protein